MQIFSTHITITGCFPTVNLHMHCQFKFWCITFYTDHNYKGFSSVNLYVFYQYKYLCKTLSTHITIIGSSPIAVPCVLCQYKFICKKLHAPQLYGYSLVWSLTCLPSQITYFCVSFLILDTIIKSCSCMCHHVPCHTTWYFKTSQTLLTIRIFSPVWTLVCSLNINLCSKLFHTQHSYRSYPQCESSCVLLI